MPGRPRSPIRSEPVLERLEPWEAKQVLRDLVGARPDIAGLAEEIARALLKDVSCEQVAEDVQDAIRSLDFGDLEAGPEPFGYTEPAEAAWQALEEALQPFVEDLKRRIELGLETEVLEVCKGIVLGLYGLREDDSHELLACAPDFPASAAAEALSAWRSTPRKSGRETPVRGRPEFPGAFVRNCVPGWQAIVDRELRRK